MQENESNFGPAYDIPSVVPTTGFAPPDLSVPLLPAAMGSLGHETPSPFATGMKRNEAVDVMPMTGVEPSPWHGARNIAYNYPPMHGSVGTAEEVQSNVAKHMVGLSILLAVGGAAIGYTQGGPYGALAGSLFGGAGVNAYRAVKFYMDGSEEGAREAVVSGTYALVAAAAGGFLWYKFVSSKPEHAKRNPECDKDVMGSNPCGIRRAGP